MRHYENSVSSTFFKRLAFFNNYIFVRLELVGWEFFQHESCCSARGFDCRQPDHTNFYPVRQVKKLGCFVIGQEIRLTSL